MGVGNLPYFKSGIPEPKSNPVRIVRQWPIRLLRRDHDFPDQADPTTPFDPDRLSISYTQSFMRPHGRFERQSRYAEIVKTPFANCVGY
jgi:hypothetical protein